MQKVSIIIPHWNGETYLKDCLSSLKQLDYENFDVILSDNGSHDKSIEVARKYFSEIIVIENGKNLGFAAACNIGIKKAFEEGSDYILLLNNDTIVESDFLTKMVSTIERDKKNGIVGCKINYEQDRSVIWYAGGRHVKWRASGQHVMWQKKDSDQLKGEHETDFVTGCTMLVRKEVFEEIGYFFEPTFLGVEDLDFCIRAWDKGWKNLVNLDAKIYHKVSLSRDGEFSFSNGYYGTRNRLHWAFRMQKNYLGALVLLLCVIPVRIIQWGVMGRRKMVKGIILGAKDFLINKTGEYKK